jgi:tRNA nucleotidyltransferase (CCA-adding enzyme)
MAISLACDSFGQLMDFFGGKKDLRDKKVRVLHDLSFMDDPTRILRCVRFEKRYGFRIEPKTLGLLKDAARSKMLERLEPQRLRDELILILKEENPLRPVGRLQELAGLKFICRHLKIRGKNRKLFLSLGREIKWFRAAHCQKRPLDTWLIYFLGLMDSLDMNAVRKACQKFAFRRGDEKRIMQYKKIKRKFVADLSREAISPSKIFSLLEPLTYEVMLLLKAKYKNRYFQRHTKDFFEIYNGMRIHVGGHDLKGLGVSPGPDYQRIFSKVLKAKLEGRVKTKEEELLLIKRLSGSR